MLKTVLRKRFRPILAHGRPLPKLLERLKPHHKGTHFWARTWLYDEILLYIEAKFCSLSRVIMKGNMCVGNEGTNVLTERCQCVYAAFHMRIENFCKLGFKRMGVRDK